METAFTRSHTKKMRGHGYKLLLGEFQLDIRGKFFTRRTLSHWNNLLMEVVDSPRLDVFKNIFLTYSALASFLLSLFALEGNTRKDLTPETNLLTSICIPTFVWQGSECAEVWKNHSLIQCRRRQVEMTIKGL